MYELVFLEKRVVELEAALRRAQRLVRLLTVGQVVDAGDDAIEAAGLNTWCVNEGLATRESKLNPTFLDYVLGEK
jgi:hypothetical protein